MKNGKRFLAMLLSASTVMSGFMTPLSDVRAAQTGQAEECEPMDPAVVEVDLPETDGEYVVYMENSQTDEISLTDDAYELSGNDSAETVLETDLSAEQIEQLEELGGSDEIYVEENIFLTGASQTDGDEDNWDELDEQDDEDEEPEWNLQMIHADDVDTAVAAETIGMPVKVAVLDSGIEFISGIPVEKSINLVKDEQDITYYMNDMTGHGTAVADIIYHIAPAAQIYSVRVLDRENRGRLSDIIAGIYWCIEQDVDVINMSFGTAVESEVLKKAVQAAAQKGILMVSSAGNGGTGSAVEYPAAYPEVIAVGAVGTDAKKTKESATGEEVELAAPGEQVLTKSILGLETVNSGTSMAAPHVAGAAALLMYQSGCKDAEYIRTLLAQSSNPLGDEEAYGYGLVDLSYAHDLMDSLKEQIPHDAEDEGAVLEDSEPDIPESLEQSERPVETFGEVDYVEGRWASDINTNGEENTHAGLAGVGINGKSFTATQIKIFKAGAVYPDNRKSGLAGGGKNPGWHGWNGREVKKGDNFIANYILATRIAVAGGKTADLQPVRGQKDATFKLMKMNISLSCIEGIQENKDTGLDEKKKRTWDTIFREEIGLGDYANKDASKQKKWRTMFLYGMALHSATDALAHNSFRKENGEMKSYIQLNCEDSVTGNNYAWNCAKNTSKKVAMHCEAGEEGDIFDLASKKLTYCWGNGIFYLANILKYAEAVNGGSSAKITEYYKPVNYNW